MASRLAAPTNDPERPEAAADLLRRLPPIAPRRIASLRTDDDATEPLLRDLFPDAELVLLEASDCVSGISRKKLAAGDFDLVVSNGSPARSPAVRQLAPQLLALTRPGGWLAFQRRNNLHEPNRQVQRMVAVDGPWMKLLLPIAKTRAFNLSVEGLNAILTAECSAIVFWETTYIRRIDDVAIIVDSMKQSSLAPYLAALGNDLQHEFLSRLRRELTSAYTRQPDGKILWRIPRLFFLAQRKPQAERTF